MFKINTDLSIEITRGDAATFNVTAQNNGENYVFQAGDIVRFKVFEKKGCDCVVLQKDFPVETAIEEVTISLTEADTKIGDLINKPKDYWYEVELNPDTYPQTIIGYDENGAKVFKLYPEGKDLGDDPITPEDIPFVDKGLDMTSHRPVENQVIATEFALVRESIKKNAETATEELEKMLPKSGGTLTGDLNMGSKKITNLATPTDNTDAVTKAYADTMLPKSGGTMTGAIAMDGSKITGLGTPTDDADAATKKYVFDTAHIYRGSLNVNIDDTTLNGLYWIVTANCTGTFPSDVSTYAYFEATGRYQKISYFANDGVSCVQERYYTNNQWYAWKRTDSLDSAPGGYGYGGYAIALPADGRTDSEAELDTALAEIYGQMNDTETKLVYWNGYPAAGTSTHGWFGILTRSSVNNGGFFGWSAYDSGTTIRKVKYNGTWKPLEIMASKAYADIGRLDRLWTNSKPTSSFAAQTVSLTLSGYDYVLVCATWDVNNPQRTVPCHIAQVGGSYDGGYMGGRNPSDGSFVGRSIDVTTSGITFAGGYKGTTADNKYCIPFAIFGINI